MLKNSNPAMVPRLGHIFAPKGGLPQLSKKTLSKKHSQKTNEVFYKVKIG